MPKIRNFWDFDSRKFLPRKLLLAEISPLKLNGYVRLTLDKLLGIRGYLVRVDEDWQERNFPQFVDALRKWAIKNPKKTLIPEKGFKCFNAYQTNGKNYKHRDYVYCEKSGYQARYCKTVSDIEERRLILSKRKICVNCTGTKHRASECLGNRSWVKC